MAVIIMVRLERLLINSKACIVMVVYYDIIVFCTKASMVLEGRYSKGMTFM